MNTTNLFVNSGIGPLQRVIIHRPDEGISRISPKRAAELLFDDIVYLPSMQQEHDVFRQVLEAFMGSENVLEIKDLLFEALEAAPDTKEEMIDLITDYEELPNSARLLLKGLSNQELSQVLITGFYRQEDYILFDPIPNFIFTRDIAVMVNDHVIITKAAREARFRENFLTRFASGDLDPKRMTNTIITLLSNELSRARGGSHCMTCPIQRASI